MYCEVVSKWRWCIRTQRLSVTYASYSYSANKNHNNNNNNNNNNNKTC